MTMWRHTPAWLVGLLLLAGPAFGPATLPGTPAAAEEDDDGAAPTEQALSLAADVHGRRPADSHQPRLPTRTAVPPHHPHPPPGCPPAMPCRFARTRPRSRSISRPIGPCIAKLLTTAPAVPRTPPSGAAGP